MQITVELALKIDMHQAKNTVKRMIAKIQIIKKNTILHGRKTTRRVVCQSCWSLVKIAKYHNDVIDISGLRSLVIFSNVLNLKVI